MKNFFLVIILLSLSFWTIQPLFHQGFFNMHDNVQVERVFEMGQALKDGQFPVRWVKDLGYGYGYPLFNFYAPLPYYFGGFLSAFGLDTLIATKLMFVVGILLGVLAMYFWMKEIWGRLGALFSAILFAYAPYRALDIYVRGAVDEFWAMSFLPLVFWGMYQTYKREKTTGIIVSTIGLSGVILSHNLTALMLTPFLFLFFVILFLSSSHKKNFLLLASCFLLLSLSISAFYWLPALVEMKYTNVFSQIGGGADFHKHFIYLDQIWDFPWGFGGSAGRESGISFKIGKPNVIFWFLSILLFLLLLSLRGRRAKREGRSNLLGILRDCHAPIKSGLAMTRMYVIFPFSIIGFLVAVFFTNSISQPIWDVVKPMAFIQYPWRFLEFSVLFSSFLAGSVIFFLEEKFTRKISLGVTLLVIVLVVIFHSKYFVPQRFLDFKSSYYTNISHLKWQVSKISDEYLPVSFPVPKNKEEVSNTRVLTRPEITIKQIVNKSNKETFLSVSDTYSTVSILTANFPGWKVWVDDQEVSLAKTPFLTFTISSGKHNIRTELTNTSIRSLANLISLFGVLGVGVILRRSKSYEKSS